MADRTNHKVRWEEMFPDELHQSIQDYPLCYLAYGLAEPHGPYNALGLDWLKARHLVERAARTHGGVVAPPFAWHMQERASFHDNGRGEGWLVDAGVKQPLCSSIPHDLFYRMALYQIRAADARGFHAAILVTGHYGGLEKTLRLLCEYYVRRTGSPMQLRAIADWECIDHEDYRGDHAGVCETSQLMALCPDLVDLERTTVPPELGTNYAGRLYPDKAGRTPGPEIGERIVASQIEGLGRMGRELLEAHRPRANWRAPTLNDAEDVWHRFERIMSRYWAPTLQEYRDGSAPEFPGWDMLGE